MTVSMANLRLATTEADLSNGYVVYSHKLPNPSVVVYNDHSAKTPTSDGGVAENGWKSVQMSFNNLDRFQSHVLRKLVDDALALSAGILWATIDKGWNGASAPNSWVDINGIPAKPVVTPAANSNGILRENVVLTINNVTIDNDPWTP